MVKSITFTVNGKEYNINVDIRKSLLEVREFFERRMKETHFM